MSNTATQRRTPSSSHGAGSRQLVGPERFFYDKSSYTGTHVNGGPDHVAKGAGTATNQSWKRPSSRGNSCGRKPFDQTASSTFEKTSAAEEAPVAQRRAASSSHEQRSRPLRGPERFFYDKSSYTGTHVNGGPDRVAKGAGTATMQSWKRPDLIRGSSRCRGSFNSTSVEELLQKHAKANEVLPSLLTQRSSGESRSIVTAGGKEGVSNGTPSSTNPGSAISPRPNSRGERPRRIVGPERFFYDKSSYTGTHVNGGPSSVAKGGGTSTDQTWKRQI